MNIDVELYDTQNNIMEMETDVEYPVEIVSMTMRRITSRGATIEALEIKARLTQQGV